MKTPESLQTLVEHGIIQEVTRPLMSGKEAQIYVVRVGDEECVAKVYKEANQRTFRHRVEYTEGRRTRNTRDQRAVSKRTRHGRKQDEAAWRTAEVDMLYRLKDAGVRVPEPINFLDGVLVMELVKDDEGFPAPRLGDLSFEPKEAQAVYEQLIQEVVRMLCGGVIHGDLSVFNVLMGADGPVVIDFPQSIDPAQNQSARKLLIRDVENLHRFLEREVPGAIIRPYAEEMWSLYESNRLTPDTALRGDYRGPKGKTNTKEVLALIDDAALEAQARQGGASRPELSEDEDAPRPLRKVVDFTQDSAPRRGAKRRGSAPRAAGPARSEAPPADGDAPAKRQGEKGAGGSRKRGRRRRRRAPKSEPESSSSPAPEAGAPSQRDAQPSRSRRRGGRSRSSGRSRASSGEGEGNRTDKPGPAPSGEKESGGPSRPARRRRRRPPRGRKED
jgi:RIO kinase 1